jgi:hypothetical protein
VPAAVKTDVDGLWTQTGFAFGTIYRATPVLSGFVSSPGSLPFAAPSSELDVVMLPAASATTCPTTPPTLAFGATLTRFLDGSDCRIPFFTDFTVDRYVFTATAGANVRIGLSSSDVAHIFEPYFRAQFSDTITRRGAGLGLTLVQQIAASHGGKVEVESEAGHGSTFRLLFPRHGINGHGEGDVMMIETPSTPARNYSV